MFQGLQQGASLFILYKNEPRVEKGRVLNVNTHIPQFNPSQPMGVLSGLVSDLTVAVGNETIPFAGLPASASSANFPDKGIFISEDQGLVVGELTSLRENSQRIVESYDTHKVFRDKCDALLLNLNPEKKERMQQEAKIASLEQRLSDVSGQLGKLTGMLSDVLERNKKEE